MGENFVLNVQKSNRNPGNTASRAVCLCQ